MTDDAPLVEGVELGGTKSIAVIARGREIVDKARWPTTTPDATLDAMEAAVGGHPEVPGAHGQLLVGAGGRLRYDVALGEVPRRETASWAPLPDLMPLVAQLGARVPYVLALVDRVGADVVVVGPDGAERERETVEGGTYPIRKVGVGGWAHLRYQHRAEDHPQHAERDPRRRDQGGRRQRDAAAPPIGQPGQRDRQQRRTEGAHGGRHP